MYDTSPLAPNIDRSVKDLQRCTASLTRYRMVVKEEMDSSIKRMKQTFAELQSWCVSPLIMIKYLVCATTKQMTRSLLTRWCKFLSEGPIDNFKLKKGRRLLHVYSSLGGAIAFLWILFYSFWVKGHFLTFGLLMAACWVLQKKNRRKCVKALAATWVRHLKKIKTVQLT